MSSVLTRFVAPVKALVQIGRIVRDALDRWKPVYKTEWGFNLRGNQQMALGLFEPDETKLIRDLLQQVDVFVNVGANIGYYCCHALSLGKAVVAIEPNQRNLYYLLKNIKENIWEVEAQAEIYPIALSDRPGVGELWGTDTGASMVEGWANIPQENVSLVPLNTLDALLRDSFVEARALILVDIEGSELKMLKGAIKTLSREPKPIWIVEVVTWQNQPTGVGFNPDFKDIFDTFYYYGYRSYSIKNSTLEEITPDTVQGIKNRSIETAEYTYLFR